MIWRFLSPIGSLFLKKSVLSGDGVPDIILMSGNTVYIFKNALGKKLPDDVPMGTEVNFTLY